MKKDDLGTITSYVEGVKFSDKDEKDFFVEMAKEYEKGGEEYYAYTPEQLALVSDVNLEGSWARFLSHPSIKAWLDKRMAIILDTVKRHSTLKYMEAVKQGDVSSSDIKNITAVINDAKEKDNNVRIFITRIPEKDEE